MIERISNYPGYLIRFKALQDTSQAVLLLHGFPGNGNVKNLDLAYWLHLSLRAHIYLLHYDGLGESRGQFKFTTALKNAVAVVDLIPQLGHKLTAVVGHSWGGLVGMHLGAERANSFEHLVLLSPLSDLDESDPLYPWLVRGVRNDCPGIYDQLSEAEVLADLKLLAAQHMPRDMVARIPAHIKTTFIQAGRDTTTPPVRAKALLKHFAVQPHYLELDMDHSFTQDRNLLAATIVAALPKHLQL